MLHHYGATTVVGFSLTVLYCSVASCTLLHLLHECMWYDVRIYSVGVMQNSDFFRLLARFMAPEIHGHEGVSGVTRNLFDSIKMR
jgi:hypothetical protein